MGFELNISMVFFFTYLLSARIISAYFNAILPMKDSGGSIKYHITGILFNILTK